MPDRGRKIDSAHLTIWDRLGGDYALVEQEDFLSIPKTIVIGSISLFVVIGILAILKKSGQERFSVQQRQKEQQADSAPNELKSQAEEKEHSNNYLHPIQKEEEKEDVDQVWRLFTTGKHKLSIVETIRYKSHVPWLKGRPAWIADYASHYSTSRHFIARSLNDKRDYHRQNVSSGDFFNILKENLNFYLVVDLSRCKMWFYAHDLTRHTTILLKKYRVGLGRFSRESHSGILTPKGKFRLGDKIAVYRPGMFGHFHNEKIELIRIFGTRWIPFTRGLDDSEGVDSPKGYGFHGAPWIYDEESHSYCENLATIGKYESDGSVQLSQDDMEELFSIVITRPTTVEVVLDFHDATPPGGMVEE